MQRFQFSLGNLLLATVFVAVSAAAVADMVRRPPPFGPSIDYWLAAGAALGAAWGSLMRGYRGILRGAYHGCLVTVGLLFVVLMVAALVSMPR